MTQDNCKKCHNKGYIVTVYRDGHEDVHICDCEYNIFKQLHNTKKENKKLKTINSIQKKWLYKRKIKTKDLIKNCKYWQTRFISLGDSFVERGNVSNNISVENENLKHQLKLVNQDNDALSRYCEMLEQKIAQLANMQDKKVILE